MTNKQLIPQSKLPNLGTTIFTQMSALAQLVFNNRLDAGLTIFFMVVVVVLALFSLKTALAALKEDKPTAKETPYEPMPADAENLVAQARRAH